MRVATLSRESLWYDTLLREMKELRRSLASYELEIKNEMEEDR